MSDESSRRKAIAETAKDFSRSTGGRVTFEQAKQRITEARRRGDRIRANNNK